MIVILSTISLFICHALNEKTCSLVANLLFFPLALCIAVVYYVGEMFIVNKICSNDSAALKKVCSVGLLLFLSTLASVFLSSCYCYTRVGDALNSIGKQVPDYAGEHSLNECKFWQYKGNLYAEIPFCWNDIEAPPLLWCGSIMTSDVPLIRPRLSSGFHSKVMAGKTDNKILVSTNNGNPFFPLYTLKEDFDYDEATPIAVSTAYLSKKSSFNCRLRDGKWYVQVPVYDEEKARDDGCVNHTWKYYAMRPLVYAGYIADIPLSITLTALEPIVVPVVRVINKNRK